MGGKGTNTVEQQSGPPAQYLQAYQNVQNQATNVASTPYQSYPGQIVAQLSPDQMTGIGQVEWATSNGGVQQPYLSQAQNDFTSATQPLLTSGLQSQLSANSGSAIAAPTANGVSGIQGAAGTGVAGIEGAAAGLTPASVQQWQSPYTQDVVNATQAEFNNQNAQQQSQVAGNAISSGAFGGDRASVASALTAQQQQLAQAPVIAGLEQSGYNTALSAAQNQAALQTQAATSAGQLGLGGAEAAGSLGLQGATTGSQLGLQGAQVGLSANEANAWLNSQAAFGEGSLGQEAQSTDLTGANALLSTGALGQQEAQENLNVPYEEYLAAQAYPFQTTGWEANIAEGLGGASGGTSSTTSPGPSVASEIGGLGLGAIGLSQSGALSGIGNGLSSIGSGIGNLFNGYSYAGLPTASTLGSLSAQAAGNVAAGAAGLRRGGMVPHRAPGGGLSGFNPLSTPSSSSSVVPGADGMGAASAGTGATPYILGNYGSTTTTSGGGGGFLSDVLPAVGIASHFLKRGGGIERRDSGGATNDPSVSVTVTDPTQGLSAANSWQSPLIAENLDAQMAASLTPPPDTSANTSGMAAGGQIHRKHFDLGGFSSSMESPWWERSEQRQATDRHGLLASPIAGRTDKLAVNPATGSYVVPADVIAGLGEGNTLAGANVMQRKIDTGPHGLQMQPSRAVKGFPHPPPVYREGEGDDGMASGGGVPPHYASGGMSPAAPLSGTGIPELDAYMNPSQASSPSTSSTPSLAGAQPDPNQVPALSFNGTMAHGGMIKRDSGGPTNAVPPVDVSGVLDMSGPDAVILTPHSPSADVPDEKLSVPPIPPSSPPPSTRGMSPVGEHGRLSARGLQPSGPQSVDGPPPSPTPQGMGAPSKPDKTDKFDDYLSKFQASKPDPWLDLAEAGFSMAAGRSPHALENIGAGAARGVAAYQQQKQEQAKEGLQAGETAARLADTDLYKQGVLGNRDRSLDIKQAGQDALSQYRDAFLKLKSSGQSDQDADRLAKEQIAWANVGVRQQGVNDRANLGYANLAQRQQAQDAVAQYRDAMTKNRAMTTAETANWHAYMKSKGATDEDIRLATSMNSSTGQPNFPNPHAAGDQLRAQNAPTAPPSPAPAAGGQPPLGQVLGVQ